jgi:hypothetical protein
MAQEQQSFADALLGPGIGRNRRLERIAGLIDWREVERLSLEARPGETGRPPYPPLAIAEEENFASAFEAKRGGRFHFAARERDR